MPGPVPKRSDQRRRQNKATITTISGAALPVATIPEPDPDWHPMAIEWFESLASSRQSEFYQASDWATAYYVAEVMSLNLKSSRFSGRLFGAVMTAMNSLLTTEGARSQLRMAPPGRFAPSEELT